MSLPGLVELLPGGGRASLYLDEAFGHYCPAQPPMEGWQAADDLDEFDVSQGGRTLLVRTDLGAVFKLGSLRVPMNDPDQGFNDEMPCHESEVETARITAAACGSLHAFGDGRN